MFTSRTVCAAALVLVAAPSAGRAQTGGSYSLTWSSIDCGSPAQSSAGGYLLGGTTGQPDSGRLAGGAYVMEGGFDSGSLVPTDAPEPEETDAGALVFRLHGSTPNPFAASTAIAFSLARETAVDLRIYDLAGRLVRTIAPARLGPGRHHVVWDGLDDTGGRVAKGVYLLRLRASGFEARRKLVLLR
jgi:hypothetical protein